MHPCEENKDDCEDFMTVPRIWTKNIVFDKYVNFLCLQEKSILKLDMDVLSILRNPKK